MPLDTDEILVGANGSLAVAPVGSTMPTDPTTALDAAFTDLGYATDDGARWSDSKSVNDRMVWQSFYTARKIVESRANKIMIDLTQWNKDTLALALGGGTVTEPVPASGNFQFDPPSPETIDERAFVLSWQDGALNYRVLYWRAVVTSDIETALSRSASAEIPLEIEALPYQSNPIYRLLTDDAAFDPS